MKKSFFSIAMLTALFFTSCQENAKKEDIIISKTETSTNKSDEIVRSTSIDENGKKLEMTFNNTKDIVTINFNGENIELKGQQPGSGIRYTNDHYELTGKGNDVKLTKDGKVIFEHNDEIVTTSVKNKKGQTLDMTFNNSTNQASIFLNGGEQIDLVNQKAASGIWYKNNHYELRGKGQNITLTKDGKTVFEK